MSSAPSLPSPPQGTALRQPSLGAPETGRKTLKPWFAPEATSGALGLPAPLLNSEMTSKQLSVILISAA